MELDSFQIEISQPKGCQYTHGKFTTNMQHDFKKKPKTDTSDSDRPCTIIFYSGIIIREQII